MIEVRLPGNAAARALTLQHARQPSPNLSVPTTVPLGRRGWGTSFLNATDDRGQAVHQFDQPLTIAVHYSREQLQALGIPQADLKLFWFDEQQREWIAVPTTVDAATNTATATVDHFSAFNLSDGSSPSAAYLPSLQGFQVGLYTGAATYSVPIDVPAGPGGLQPSLELSYSSAATDGSGGTRSKAQAGWVGKGWSFDPGGSVSLNKSAGSSDQKWDNFTFTFGGRSFDVVKGQLLPVYTDYQNDNSIDHWTWQAADENFTRVRAEWVPGQSEPTYRWKVWTKDGTRYEFDQSLWTTFDLQRREVYKWLLTKVVDPHGNTIVYDYQVDAVQKSLNNVVAAYHPTYYLRNIYWGYDGATPGTGSPRYRVELTTPSRWAAPSGNVDLTWEYPNSSSSTYWQDATPHEAYRLNEIKVWSNPSGSWQLVRQYNLRYADAAASVQADVSGGQKNLTLLGVQRVGNDGSTVLPETTFTYGMTQGDPQVPNAGWNRMLTADNGQGGRVTFTYEHVWQPAQVPSGDSYGLLYQNYYRVTDMVRQDTSGNSYSTSALTRYAYTAPALNDESHAATVVYAHYPPSGNGDSRFALARQEKREFRGHSQVIERQYDGATTSAPLLVLRYHSFYQGDNNGCTPQRDSNNRLIESDACFQEMVKREAWKGREYKTETHASDERITLQRTEHTLTRQELPFYGSDPNVSDSATLSNNYKRAGLWRAFAYESQTVETTLDGAASISKTTKYAYDGGYNQNGQYGNLGRVEEYDQTGTLVRKTEHWYNVRDDVSTYIVDRVHTDLVGDSAGNWLALTNYFYDGYPTTQSVGTKGEVVNIRKFYDVHPTNSNGLVLHSSDTSYTYDAYGNRLTETTYANAGTRQVVNGVVTFSSPGSASDPRTTTTNYDTTFHAFPNKVTNAKGHIEQAGYDYRMGTLTSVTDANNNPTSAEYDVFGRMSTLIKPGDTTLQPTINAYYYDWQQPFRYLVVYREVSGSDENRPIQYMYDGFGREVQNKRESVNGGQNIVVDTVYDGVGNVIKASQPRYVDEGPTTTYWGFTPRAADSLMRWTTTSYDALNRPLVVTNPDGTRQDHHYGIDSGFTYHDVVDANRHRTQQQYDALGRLVKVKEISGDCGTYWGYTCTAPYTTSWMVDATTTYSYSPLDLLTQVTDAKNNSTSLTYDSLGRKRTMAEPDMGAWSYSYDVNGTLKTQTDAKQQTITFGYDALDRLTTKTYPDGSTAQYRYDEVGVPNGIGQRTSMSNGEATTRWQYDTRGRTAQEAHTVTGLTPTRIFTWTYDSADRTTSITYPNGEILDYTYDGAWRQASVCSRGVVCYAANATYTALDQPQSVLLGSQTQSWSYANLMARVDRIQLSTPGLFNRSYTYHNGGNVATITDNVASQTQNFSYDHRDRLTQAWTTGSTTARYNESYSYDTIGNLMNKTNNLNLVTSKSYSYGVNGDGTGVGAHQAQTVGGWAYRYDTNGNLLSDNNRTFTWNADNQPTLISGSNIYTEAYAYDAGGERVKRARSGITTVYLGGLWEEEIQTGTTRLYYAFNGKIIAQRENGVLVYLYGDHLGSVSVAIRGDGVGLGAQDFTPWGEVRSGGISQTSLNYTGQQRDGTGLLYYHARYYDPALARFISADSVVPGSASGSMDGVAIKPLTVDFHEPGFVGSLNAENQQPFWFQMRAQEQEEANAPWGPANAQALNRYAYVQNNPLRYTDPTGHCVEAVSCAMEGAALGAVGGPVGAAVGAVIGVGAGLLVMYAGYKAGEAVVYSSRISRQKQDQHVLGTPEYQERVRRGKRTGYFPDKTTADKYVEEAWNNGRQPNAAKSGRTRQHDFGSDIPGAADENGNPTSKVRAHQDSKGKLHGYPVPK